jgi:hypothetical protein
VSAFVLLCCLLVIFAYIVARRRRKALQRASPAVEAYAAQPCPHLIATANAPTSADAPPACSTLDSTAPSLASPSGWVQSPMVLHPGICEVSPPQNLADNEVESHPTQRSSMQGRLSPIWPSRHAVDRLPQLRTAAPVITPTPRAAFLVSGRTLVRVRSGADKTLPVCFPSSVAAAEAEFALLLRARQVALARLEMQELLRRRNEVLQDKRTEAYRVT